MIELGYYLILGYLSAIGFGYLFGFGLEKRRKSWRSEQSLRKDKQYSEYFK